MLMYYFKLGVSGAAISSVISQYMVTLLMISHLNKRAILLPPRPGALQFGGYMKSGGFLLGRTLALLQYLQHHFGDINGCSSRPYSYGCSPDMSASLVGCFSYNRCTGCVRSGIDC